MKRSVLVILFGVCVASVVAEPLKIIGFETGTGITFEGATVSNYYTIEFATGPGGPWTNWGSITEQPITGSVMAVPSPFFYRIRQTDSSAFPPYAVVGHTHSNIVSSMLAPAAVASSNIANAAVISDKLADGAVTEPKISASGVLVPNLNADLLDGQDSSAFLQSGSGVANVKQVVRGVTTTFDSAVTFSPSVTASKCVVILNVIATISGSIPTYAGAAVTQLTSSSITITANGAYKVGYQIIEYN